MAPGGDVTLPATRRSRKSVGGQSPSKKTSDKENATIDVGSTLAANRKKSRSKSIGPGGLDVLKPGAGNRRVSLAAPSRPPPRSILKQTIQPLPEIPPHKPKASDGSAKTATPSPDEGTEGSTASGTKIAVRTEEQQQAAARQREELERAATEKEAADRREARRKSLANRRVSFAAEATLHTFHEIEYMHDSTTSTDSTRRASSIAGQQQQPPSSDPPEEVEEAEEELPTDKRRRRSSGIPPLNFNNPEDDTLSSTVYSSDSEHTDADGVAEIQGVEQSDSDSDVEDGTMMTVDADEMTSASVASARTEESDSTSLDENLRLAARMAATQQLDENGDEQEEEEEEIIGFSGWVKKGSKAPSEETGDVPAVVQQSPQKPDDDETDMDMDMDMEMTSAVGGILQPTNHAVAEDEEEDMDMSMDVTRALGGIISHAKPATRRRSLKPSPAQGFEDDEEDAPMDFTVAVGGIQPARTSDSSQASLEGDEDMSMELTKAIGSVLPLPANRKAPPQTRRRSMAAPRNHHPAEDDGGAMDMTVAVGRILSSAAAAEQDQDQDGADATMTMGMDMTTAIGGIIKPAPPPSQPQSRLAARKAMEAEADEPGVDAIAAVETKSPSPSKRKQPASSSAHPETDSPGMGIFRGKGLRRTPARGGAATGTPEASSPSKTPKSPPKPTTPSKQSSSATTAAVPAAAVATTPTRTPSPLKMIGSRSTSPKRPRQSPGLTTPRSATTARHQPPNPPPASALGSVPTLSLFRQDPSTGATTPRVILSPKRPRPHRRLSGVGADRAGLGSPRVSELLDRRGSIGDAAEAFSPARVGGGSGVRFAEEQSPRAMAEEVDRARREEERRENGRWVMEREGDGEADVTANLREMIQSLSPRKAVPARGRKSLHVGSARGVLGKRPAELDEEDEEVADGVKRLKGLVGSPVKNVRLGGPPSKAETTTGRRTRAAARAAAAGESVTPALSSPVRVGSPSGKGRFRDVDDEPSTTLQLDRPLVGDEAGADAEPDDDEDRIHLQDFLNMTSIRFMELTTTKRRHTVAPAPQRESSGGDAKDDMSLERCVVAGACTVPMLELYQHSCRELKKYISEGRRIIREIETETFEENPPLFREYMSAPADFKVVMDNQFKNVKTHARLLSKAMWYEWRMKLQDGLKEGLMRIAEGMAADEEALREQEALLASVVPDLARRFEALRREADELEAVARELADCDPADLEAARADLLAADGEIADKTAELEAMRTQLRESEESIAAMTARKQQCLDDIQAADQIREECRGWSSTEIATLKAKVEQLENQHGWAITGIVDTTVSLSYRREIELVLDMASFQPGRPNARIDIWYIAGRREHRPVPASVERDFFVQCMRDQVRGLPQCDTKPSRVLALVSATWDKARRVAGHVAMLNLRFPTTVVRTSDAEVEVRCSLLLAPLASKVEVVLLLRHRLVEAGDVEVDIVPRAAVVYGESFKTDKVAEFLAAKIGTAVKSAGEGEAESWLDVVAELHGRLVARGRK